MNAARLLGWALRRRCPACGGGDIFLTYFTLREQCPSCHLHLTRREQGYQVGAYMLNLAISELIGVAILGSVVVATWPNPPWDILLYGGVGIMIAAPIAFYPVARTLFLALDLAFRPDGQE